MPIKKRKFGGGFDPKKQDVNKTDFTFGGFWGGYTPKHEEVDNLTKLLEIKNQGNLNTCVVESGIGAKEPDEGVLLDLPWMCAYLKKIGVMDSRGTSLSYLQEALRKVGVPKRTGEINRNSWAEISNPKQLTEAKALDAVEHKTQSYYRTYDKNTVLEELDNGKIGHTALMWYSGYDRFTFGGGDFVITPFKGDKIYGHAIQIGGYNKTKELFKLGNSYGKEFGDNGCFYLRWADFSKVLEWGVYFNTDMPKDVVSFCSIYQNKLVKEINGSKIYLIQNDKKRHIPDWGFLLILRMPFTEDKDNILPQVPEGEPMKFEEIPEQNRKDAREIIRLCEKNEAKDLFKPYFPDLFN